jgi:uncharacterized protein (DUF1800 family)
MAEHQASAPRRRLWDRPTTRRALLAGSATVAAAGAAAAIVGVTMESGGGGGAGNAGVSADEGGVLAPEPTPDPNRPIEDPRRRAAHLLRRAGFGGTLAEIEEFSKLSREDAADRLINYQVIDNSALDGLIAQANFNLTAGRPADLYRWWLTRMAYTARPLEERMTLIWHGLLTSQISKIGGQRSKLMVTQNELYRTNALPKWDDLVKAVSKDPAMLIYLDNVDSAKAHPNENYARELMELFTLGIGNYTESDIRESARAFTGWRITQPVRTGDKVFDYASYVPQFFVSARDHDTGSKTFLGQTGNWGGDDIVDIIMKQPAAGRFITGRLFTEFANYNPAAATIDRLVAVWNASNHDIKAIVRAILVSDEFYSEASYRGFVRSPVEFMVGAIRGLQLTPGNQGVNPGLDRAIKGMDQILFEPPNVAGWPGGSTWLSSSTFFARVNFLDAFLMPRGRAIEIPALPRTLSVQETVDTALRMLVDDNVSDGSRQSISDYAKTVVNPTERAAAVAYLALASPEFQLI